jgi:hypothetical protein
MLGFLLVAGALHVRVDERASRGWAILTLATVGVLVSSGYRRWLAASSPGAPSSHSRSASEDVLLDR